MIAEDPGRVAAPPLAPLAQKVRRLLAPSAGDVVTSLDQLIDRLVDFRQGIGELELTGSVSWSDFSAIDQAARPIDISTLRLPYFNAETAVVQRYLPGIGPIGGFYFNSVDSRLFVVSQGNEWKIWSWTQSPGKRLIANHLRFPIIAGTPDGQVYVHHDDDKTLTRLSERNQLERIKTGLYVERLETGQAPDELLIVGEAASVDEKAPIWSLRGGTFTVIDRFTTSGLWSLIRVSADGLLYTSDTGTAVMIRDHGHERPFARDLVEPGELTATGESVYCLSRSKLRLYRLSSTGVEEAPLIGAAGDALLAASRDPDGFQATAAGTLLITSGVSVVEIAPTKLRWNRRA
jgi:hypothetical protein